MHSNKIILKIILLFILLFNFSGCFFYYDYNDYDNWNLKYIDENRKIEEEKRKLEERERKILARNYINETFNPYFSLLNEKEKQVYYDIYENANNFSNDFFELTYKINSDRLDDVFYSVYYDNPELIWLKTYWFYKDEENMVYKVMLIYYSRNKEEEKEADDIVSFVKEKNQNMISDFINKNKEINIVVDNIVRDANQYRSIIEKEKYVHDYLVNKITYDKNMHEDQTAYGALINNRAVCSGYSRAFQLIMRKLNIPCFYIRGNAYNEEGEVAHAWNLILLDGDYYNVDVTWDDPIDYYTMKNRLRYDYFNVSDEFISKNHTREELSSYLPIASGIRFSNLYR